MIFRDLKKEEIDVRVGQVGDDFATLLLYKDARVDMDILDETVGSENWQRKHYEVKGNMYCSVGIKCNDEWVWKDDCGTESNTEKEKGESSDSFKRACVNWGIGRELYTSPKIFINCETAAKKIVNLTNFEVSDIEIKDKAIVKLSIKAYNKHTRKSDIVFDWSDKKTVNTPQKADEPLKTDKKPLTLEEAKALRSKSGLTLDRFPSEQLEAFLTCGNAEYREAAKLIIEDRKKNRPVLEETDEKLPWEE